MNNQDKIELNTYQRLSPEARERNKKSATKYSIEKCTRITIKAKIEDFADINDYMNRAIADGKSKSKNNFLLSAIRYAISNDFKELN